MGETALTLAIETSNPTAHEGAAGVALVRVGEGVCDVVAKMEVRSAERHDDPLMPAIDSIVRDAHFTPGDIQRVAVSVGPGGYTACRTAVTTAKIICRFTGASAIPVPSELGVHAALDPMPNEPATICLAWKGAEVWARTFAPGEREAAAPGRVVSIDALDDLSFGMLVCDDKLAASLPENRTIPIRFDPVAVARASAHLSAVDPMELAVAYPREPEAVRKWRELGR